MTQIIHPLKKCLVGQQNNPQKMATLQEFTHMLLSLVKSAKLQKYVMFASYDIHTIHDIVHTAIVLIVNLNDFINLQICNILQNVYAQCAYNI